MPRLSTPRIQLGVVTIVAFVLRSIWLLRHGSQWAFTEDSDLYLALAEGIANGCGFAPYVGNCGLPELFRTPGYPVFLVPFLGDNRAVVVAQAAIGALNCLIVARFTARRGRMFAGIIAAAFLAVDIPTIVVSKALVADALFQAVATLTVFTSLDGEGIFSGVMSGVAALVRPVGIVLVPVVALALLWRHHWRSTIAAMAVSLLMIGGWALRNDLVGGTFTLSIVGSSDLYYFFAPVVLARHNDIPVETVTESFDRDIEALVASQHRDVPTDVAAYGTRMSLPFALPGVSSFMLSKVISVILHHPIDAAIVTFDGFRQLAFEPYRLETGWQGFITDRTILDKVRLISSAVQWAVLVLLWIGIIRALWASPRDYERWVLLSAALLLILAASPLVLVLNGRFRCPAIPFLAALAGLGLSSIGRQPGLSDSNV